MYNYCYYHYIVRIMSYKRHFLTFLYQQYSQVPYSSSINFFAISLMNKYSSTILDTSLLKLKECSMLMSRDETDSLCPAWINKKAYYFCAFHMISVADLAVFFQEGKMTSLEILPAEYLVRSAPNRWDLSMDSLNEEQPF